MASYRPFPPPPPPPSNFGPQPPINPNNPNMYSHMFTYPTINNPNPNHHHHHQHPPPPSSSLPPPPLTQPPPPPTSVSVTNQTKGHTQNDHKDSSFKDLTGLGSGSEPNEKVLSKQQQQQQHAKLPPVPTRMGKRGETEEERRVRKKREMEEHRKQLKESQKNKVLDKTQMLSSSSVGGSHMGERRATAFLSGERRRDNRLKKPTTFLCKLKFRDELPDTAAQPNLLSLRRDKDRVATYAITSLEKVNKSQFYVEPDLGIPLDLLDLSVYNVPKDEIWRVAPEDEKLLEEEVSVTPIKNNGLKRKERPTDKGMSWLVKTQYISPLSTEAARQSLSEKKAKELRETRELILHSSNSRERKIQDIEASFEACKSHPVHATNKKLQPVEILPLFPDFERWNDQFVVATFDGAPTADSERYSKMDKSVRDAHESQAIMKSFVASTSGSAKPDKFLAYMVPSVGELSKDLYDEHEDISYTWVREYHWDVRGEDADDPTNYLVVFGESEAGYVPLPTKLILRKKRAREGKTSDDVEHFRVPESITVRKGSTVAIDMKESESYVGSKGRNSNSNSRHHDRMTIEDGQQKGMQDDDDDDVDQFSAAEDNMSD